MKLPFNFSLKFVFRLLLPGFIISISIFPIIQTICFDLNVSIPIESCFFISIIIFGWVFIIFDMPIYMFFEGRRYWPSLIKKFMIWILEKRLERLKSNKEKYKINNRQKYLEVSVELRRYPLNGSGDFVTIYPTMLGNLINSYEDHPRKIYGMDPVFYWYRIWLMLDEKTRKDIDDHQALADSAVYVSFALLVTCFTCICYYIILNYNLISLSILPSKNYMIFFAVLSLIFFVFIYRLSLHLHEQFGEIFKSVFDCYRKKFSITDILEDISKIAEINDLCRRSKKEKYEIVWRYLKNYKIKINDINYNISEFPIKKENEQGK